MARRKIGSRALVLAALAAHTYAAEVVLQPAVALFDFAAREDDELSLKTDDAIMLLPPESGDEEEGWVRVRRRRDGVDGLVPLSYVGPADADGCDAHTAEACNRGLSQWEAAEARAAAAERRVGLSSEAGLATRGSGAGGHGAGSPDVPAAAAPAVSEALDRYRRRPALYNTDRPSAISREQRWGVGLGLEEQGLPAGAGAAAPAAVEHRSGVGGVPFFNLAEVLDEETLASEVAAVLRRLWWGGDGSTSPFVPGLASALQRAADPLSRDVVLTFANSGYADFVLNGFPRTVVPNTLVVALDATAHATFEAAGYVSYFEPNLPPVHVGQQMQGSDAFMDIMKLRLLCAAEALLLKYNVLLTDADAVFLEPPWRALDRTAALSLACDATVVPRSWREAPGMVMAGFWFARGDSARPLIFLVEVLEYQAHHPNEHDQQAFNQILSELLSADLRVALLHPRLFPSK